MNNPSDLTKMNVKKGNIYPESLGDSNNSYLSDSQIEEGLDTLQICDETFLDFTQANLSK